MLVFRVFIYVLALAAQRTGVSVHAVCVLGNHYHAVVTAPAGMVEAFYHYLHEFTAKCLNSKRGRWENMWAITPTNRVSLEDDAAVLDKVIYTLCNPVSSELLSRAKDWEGICLWWANEPVTVPRPDYFRENGPLPPDATLTATVPPAFKDQSDGGIELVKQGLKDREHVLREEMRRAGRRFVGKRRLAKQRWTDCPKSFAARMKMRPRVATRDKWRRIEAIQRNKQFELDHASSA